MHLGWLLAEPDTPAEDEGGTGIGSVFEAAVFAPRLPSPARFVSGLRDLIASVEADGRGYDTIHLSATRLPERPPTRLTLAEIRQWIADTPGQQHAIGRYQIIPSTLDMLAARLGLPASARFSPALQDRMADSLMRDAGLDDYLAGRIGRESFLDGLAKIWAGLPDASGRSAWHHVAGNRAGISRAAFRESFGALLPDG